MSAWLASLVLSSLLLSAIACERRTEVKLDGENPPTFLISGSGKLGELVVYGPEQESIVNPFDDTYALWEVAPKEEGEAAEVEELEAVTYGVVPKGYKQVKPENTPPPTLTEGTRYGYWLVTVNAPHAAGYIEIRNGKAIKVKGPDREKPKR